jgi:hypothetical protein
MYLYSKRYYAIQNIKSRLSDALYNTKYHVSNVIDRVRYAESDTWLGVLLTTTWILCAIVASVN